MPVYDAQGHFKEEPATVPRGTIVAFYGPRIPEGWQLCAGTDGTPNLVAKVVVGASSVSTGTDFGTENFFTLPHSGFGLTGTHSNHSVTQPSDHSAHSPTQPSGHSNHTTTPAGNHSDHSADTTHTHNAHTQGADGSGAVTGQKLTGATVGGGLTHTANLSTHTHDAHSAHVWPNSAVNAHNAHTGFAVSAGLSHFGADVSSHTAHGPIIQPEDHTPKQHVLAFIMKL